VSAFAQLGELPPLQIWDGVAGRALHGERLTLSVVELDPGTIVPEHAHENEQIGMVVSGSVSFRVADETRELAPGGTWCILANVPHEVHTGPQGAVVIEAFGPARSDWESLERRPPTRPRWPSES
jgi:quercetin dioxygenase-like cupin family protein